ncbi:MAG: FkbM family methyltransferase, partial [Ruminiclostridium sp.]
DTNNYGKLMNYITSNNLYNIDTYNIALYNNYTELKFNTTSKGGNTANFIDEQNGDTIVHADSLDCLCCNEKIDFIKMDIEGSEYEALEGAKTIIARYHPILAICVYHKKDDFIKIPLLIKQIEPKYKLYFKHYSYCDAETICYAIYEDTKI